jgi:putative endonuclease
MKYAAVAKLADLLAGRQAHTLMIVVYAISSIKSSYIYVGQTNRLARRLLQHNSGKERTTRPHKPFKFIYSESFANRQLAREKEKYLKSGAGKEFLKTL